MWKVCRSSILRLSVLLLYEGSGLLLRRVLVSFYNSLIQVVLAVAEKLTSSSRSVSIIPLLVIAVLSIGKFLQKNLGFARFQWGIKSIDFPVESKYEFFRQVVTFSQRK